MALGNIIGFGSGPATLTGTGGQYPAVVRPRASENPIYVFPEDYGAAGDGVADDTDALLACYSYSPIKPVYLSQIYRFTSPLSLNNRRTHGRIANGSKLIADNSAGGFSSAGYAIRFGNETTGFSVSYGTEFREVWLDMDDAPGIDAFKCTGVCGELTTFYRVIITNIEAVGTNWVHGIYVENYYQNLEISQLWSYCKPASGDYTKMIRLPQGRGCTIQNFTTLANIGIELGSDGANILTGHMEAAGTSPASPYGIGIKSYGSGSWQDNPDPIVNISGINFRNQSGGGIIIASSASSAALHIASVSKLVAKTGESGEFYDLITDNGRTPAVSSTERSIALYARQGTNVITTDSALT